MTTFLDNQVTAEAADSGHDAENSNRNSSSASPQISWQLGADTDIGGGRENQDDYLIWQKPSLGICVICIFDGHGREVGKIASGAAKASVQRFCEESVTELQANPSNWLIKAHVNAHSHIKAVFKTELERQGYEVREAPEGYLLKRKMLSMQWTCVHGGSSSSIVAIVGTNMYIANVGDSTATLCTAAPVLNRTILKHLTDAAIVNLPALPTTQTEVFSDEEARQLSNTLPITAEHSPESVHEFYRLRAYRSRDADTTQPSLLIVYDAPSVEKARCNPVFELNGKGVPCVTNRGRYYKNVRKEWASLVSTPVTARFQDALAFTRSLGDLHLHTYGVTHLPEVQHIDLRQLFQKIAGHVPEPACSETASEHADGSLPTPPIPLACLVVCSDGVWDNWTYQDVTRFVLDRSCVNAVCGGADGAKRVTVSFMQRNEIYAKRNFGPQADNATGILVYLSDSSYLPVQPQDT